MSLGDALTMGNQGELAELPTSVLGRRGTRVRELTPEQEATIDQRLDQAGAFMQEGLVDPAVLTDSPDGSVLRFSNVTIGNVDFQLTAYADANDSQHWTARVAGPAEWAAEGRKPFSAPA